MNIGIVTVFNSMNDGSFWQAMILKRELEKRGNCVAFFKIPDNPERPALTKKIICRIVKYLIRDGFLGCYKYILSIKEFAEEKNIEEAHTLFEHLCYILIEEKGWTDNVADLKKFFKKARKEMEGRQITMTGKDAKYIENPEKE